MNPGDEELDDSSKRKPIRCMGSAMRESEVQETAR
jgi:hypothetical protein